MTTCTKCGAELIGSRKFCATCGTPTVDPRSGSLPLPAGSSPRGHSSTNQSVAPESRVDPFAQTAPPGPKNVRTAEYGPPPAPPPVSVPAPSHVSPLAVSNIVPPRAEAEARAFPSTQAMPNFVPTPASVAASVAPSPQKTQVLHAFPPSAPRMPVAVPSPGSAFQPASAPQPRAGFGHPYAQAPYPAAPAQQQVPVPPAAYAYGAYPPQAPQPGAHVFVTWSNGQRYPGTVQQVSGTQCLIIFPDGQQHWVEMQYLAPT